MSKTTKAPKDPNKTPAKPNGGKGKGDESGNAIAPAKPATLGKKEDEEVLPTQTPQAGDTQDNPIVIPAVSTPSTQVVNPAAVEPKQEEPKELPKEDVKGVAMMANMPAPNVVIGVTALKEVVVLKTVEDLGRVPVITMTDEVRQDLTPSTLTYAIARIEVKKEMERVKGTVHITQLLYAHEL